MKVLADAEFGHYMTTHVWLYSNAQTSRVSFFCSHQRTEHNIVQTFPEYVRLKEFSVHLLALHAPPMEPGLFFITLGLKLENVARLEKVCY